MTVENNGVQKDINVNKYYERDFNYMRYLDIDSYNIFSKVFLLWLSPLVSKGYKRRLEPSDIWYLRKGQEADTLNKRFWDVFNKIKSTSGNPNQILWEVSFVLFRAELGLAFMLHMVAVILRFAGPFLLNRLVTYLDEGADISGITELEAYGYAVALGVSQGLGTVFNSYSNYMAYSVALKSRSMLTSAVFDKVLSLDAEAKQETTQGQIVTLISSDAAFVVELTRRWNQTLSAPLILIAGSIYVYFFIGVATFAGLAILCVSVPVTMFLGKLQIGLQRNKLKFTDKRLSFAKEVLQGIKIIKFYAWEQPAVEKLEKLRERELSYLLKTSYLRAFMLPIALVIPNVASVMAFTVYLLTNDGITPAEAFTVVSLFVIIRSPFVTFPLAISTFTQAYVSFKRIATFLLLTTLPKDNLLQDTGKPSFGDIKSVKTETVLEMKNACFRWPKTQDQSTETKVKKENESNDLELKNELSGKEMKQPFELKDITFSVKKGELVVIVGRVGSGKSSLCSAILEEMPLVSAKTSISKDELIFKKVAYCEQQPFIINATVKANILFHRRLSEDFYKKTVRSSCLISDLQIFPAQDMTEIGERGVTLSGGQKSRISIARSIYSKRDNCEIYIFDDPLSAVDAEVSQKLFTQILSNDEESLLKDNTRILVTNQINILDKVDKIIVLERGKVVQIGSYHELLNQENSQLAQLVSEEKAKEKKEVGVDETEIKDVQPKEKKVSNDGEAFQKNVSEVLAKGKVTSIETRERGAIKWSVVKNYWLAGSYNSCTLSLLLIFLFFLCEANFLFIDSWLAIWTQEEDDDERLDISTFLGVFWLIVLVYLLFILIRSLTFVRFGVNASKNLYERLNQNVLKLPMSFFWKTPLGTIVNRLSQDTFNLDSILPNLWQWLIMTLVRVFGSLIFITYTSPVFAVVLIPVSLVYILMRNYYRSTSRELQRIEAITMSPLLNQLGESFHGVVTLRAFDQIELWNKEARLKIEHAHRARFAMEIAQIWLQERLEFLGAFIVLTAGLSLLISTTFTEVAAGLAGLSLSQALNITINLSFSVVMATQLEARLNAVERILEYSDLPTEELDTDANIKDDKRSTWPDKGKLELQNVFFRYRDDLKPALADANLIVNAGESVGLVGRTGAGKSTIMVALFRLVDIFQGKILIDDVDISSVSKTKLRKAVTLIPQDPVLFVGTLRYNLDPFNKYSDEEVNEAISKSHLKEIVDNLQGGLSAQITENGANLSVGQRALVCLARALLRKSKIVLLDEATASVDSKTDSQIQETIRNAFKSKVTLIVIAHRLRTIIDSDKIVVLSEGKIVEVGHPHDLLQNKDSFFTELVSHTGNATETQLRSLAEQAHQMTVAKS